MKSIKGNEVNSEMLGLVNETRGLLASSTACKNSFLGKNAKDSTNTITTIVDDSATPQIRLEIGKTYGSTQIKIADIKLSDADPDVEVTGTSGTTNLLIIFERPVSSNGSKTVGKKVRLSVVVDGANNITDCSAISVGTDLKNITDNSGAACTAGNEGTIRYVTATKKTQVCDGTNWRTLKYEERFFWANAPTFSSGHNTVCTAAGGTAATDQGYGICASGENKPNHGDNAFGINYQYGMYNYRSSGGNQVVGTFCYFTTQPRDNDGSDRIVAWLCERP